MVLECNIWVSLIVIVILSSLSYSFVSLMIYYSIVVMVGYGESIVSIGVKKKFVLIYYVELVWLDVSMKCSYCGIGDLVGWFLYMIMRNVYWLWFWREEFGFGKLFWLLFMGF